MEAEAYLRSFMPSREEVERFLSREVFADPVRNNAGWTYDAGLGWVLKDSCRDDGIAGSRTFYRYEPGGARVRINAADRPCRMHAYGNSFTHCDQVSDGETWEEYLAAHLREPVMNFGVGGYGVYQAFLRMRRQEAIEPARYVILNIWHDDHFRNLDSWRAIRFGYRTPCGFTLPHLAVDPEAGTVEERPNLCPTAQDVFGLCDPGFVLRTFGHDPALGDMLREHGDAGIGGAYFHPSAMSPSHIGAALLASRRIVEWAERECAERGQQLLIMLSHGSEIVREELAGLPRWDAEFVDWVRKRPGFLLDLRDVHRNEFASTKLTPDGYLDRYYNGHYAPAGNQFTAEALRPLLADRLDPRPEPYLHRRAQPG
jgi:hypothetical protein